VTTISPSGVPGDNDWFTSDAIVTLSAIDDSEVDKTEYSFDNATWTTYTAPFTITNEGNNIVYYKSTDKAGNPETTKTKAIKIDKTIPSGTIAVNNDTAYANSTSVTLTLTATDAISGVFQVRFSNDGVWDTEPWETLSATKTWILQSGDGTKTVFCQIKDKAGLISPSYQDSIQLDATKPTANAGQDQTVNVGETVNFDAGGSSDNVGIVSYEWNFGDGTTATGKTTTHIYTILGPYTVTLTVKDAAGNTATDSLIITVRSAEAPPPPAEAFPMLIIGAGAAIAAIGIAVAATLLLRKRK
jgi:PKD repeat protein